MSLLANCVKINASCKITINRSRPCHPNRQLWKSSSAMCNAEGDYDIYLHVNEHSREWCSFQTGMSWWPRLACWRQPPAQHEAQAASGQPPWEQHGTPSMEEVRQAGKWPWRCFKTFITGGVFGPNGVSQFPLPAISSLYHIIYNIYIYINKYISLGQATPDIHLRSSKALDFNRNAPASSAYPTSSAKRHHYSPRTEEGLPLMLPVAFAAPQSQNDTRTASCSSSRKELPLDPSKVQNLSHGGCGFTC